VRYPAFLVIELRQIALIVPEPLQEGGQARVYLCTYQDKPIVLKVYKSASGSALERELSAVSKWIKSSAIIRHNDHVYNCRAYGLKHRLEDMGMDELCLCAAVSLCLLRSLAPKCLPWPSK